MTITSLRRSERSVPGHAGHTVTGLGAFVENTVDNFTGFGNHDEEYFCGIFDSDNDHDYEPNEIYLNSSLYLPPESLYDLHIEEDELEDDFRDPDCVYVAEDVPVDKIIPKDVAIAICATASTEVSAEAETRPRFLPSSSQGRREARKRQRQAQRRQR